MDYSLLSRRLMFCCGLAVLSLAAPTRAQDANRNLLQNGAFHQDLTGWTLQQGNVGQAESVDADIPGAGQTYKQALRVTVQGPPVNGENAPPEEGAPENQVPAMPPDTVALSQVVPDAIDVNDRLTLKFWARADAPSRLETVLIQNAPPVPRLRQVFELSDRWKEYEMTGVFSQPLAAKSHKIAFHLAFAPTAIELTGVRLTHVAGEPATEVGPTTPVIAPETPALLLADVSRGVEGWSTSTETTRSSVSVIALKDSPYPSALRVAARPRSGDAPGRVYLRRTIPEAVKSGEKLVLKAWARSAEAVPINMLIANRRDTYAPKLIQKLKVPLTAEWQLIEARGVASKDYVAGGLEVVFELALKPGVIDFAAVSVAKATE